MRVVWDAERRTLPRIVILDFDRAEVGQDGWYVATEEDTIQDFLSELGVWGSDDVITDWVEGPGSVQYDGFAIDLLPPHMREARRKVKEQGRLENRLFNESEEGKRLDAEWKAGLQASSGMQQAPKEYEVISTGTLGDLDSGME